MPPLPCKLLSHTIRGPRLDCSSVSPFLATNPLRASNGWLACGEEVFAAAKVSRRLIYRWCKYREPMETILMPGKQLVGF